MNRTSSYKLLYISIVVVAIATVAAVSVRFELGTLGLLFLAMLLFLPGRIGGYVLRDLFRGRHFVTAKEYEKAIAASELFLDVIDHQPWRQYFMYCFFGIYTWNTRAMALNNIGAANMELGHLSEAESQLVQALEFDDDYPIPYFNLAVIAAAREDMERSDQMLSNARQRGYNQSNQSLTDEVIARVATAYARLQSFPH